jgi:general secretion pathway protein N
VTRRAPLLALLLVAVLLAGLALVLLSARDASQPAASAPPAMASEQESAGPFQPPSLQDLAAAWQQPLFNPDRGPDAQGVPTSSGPDLSTFLLTGIIIEGDHRIALFKQQGGTSLALREGATLKDGWRIRRIEPRRVELHNSSESRMLQLLTPRLPSAPATAKPRTASPVRP